MRGRPSSNPALTRFVDLQGSRDVPLEPQSSSLFSLLPTLPAQERDWRLVAAGLILVSLLTMAGFWIEPIIKGPNLAILYMLAVVFVALWWGKWAAILSAI